MIVETFRTPATPSWLGRTIVVVRARRSEPPIAIDTDAARAAAIIERHPRRYPQLIRADLLLVARLLAD